VAAPEPARALRRNAPEEVADAIRAWMFGRGLEPGDRLGREEDLARRFGVSRPTLREALRLLSSAHLVRATKGPGGGIFVAATPEQGIGRSVTDSVASMLSADSIDLEELIETRILLEVPLAGLAAQRASEDDVTALRSVLDAAGESTRDEAFRGFDTRLHGLIAEIAGNRLARAFTEWIGQVLQPPLHVLIEPAVVDEVVVEQHRDIVRAIERGDPPAAERAMREHLVYLHDLVSAVRRAGER
jgi:GntR family transcriptional repressor for pyruvate dehydrogenase complex